MVYVARAKATDLRRQVGDVCNIRVGELRTTKDGGRGSQEIGPHRIASRNEMKTGYIYEGDDWVQGGEIITSSEKACKDCSGRGADGLDR
jgi:hypothetical protein